MNGKLEAPEKRDYYTFLGFLEGDNALKEIVRNESEHYPQ